MPRQIFKKCVIAVAGPLPGQLTIENLTQWTRIRKGIFSEDFDEFVTHLLCTREQFNKRVPRVKQALKRGKRFHIVHYDWFEFSAVYEKKEPELAYSMRALLAKQKAREREERRIEKGRADEEKFVNTNLFHIYTDREFFSYQIDITRDDTESGELGQRYTMCESDAKPHLYQFTAKFLKRKGDGQPSYYRPSLCAGKWRAEMDHFTAFFQKKTGIEWQDRVLMQKTTSTEHFQYAPPTGGKPIGRRLRHSYDYCLEINAELRGLPWPPVEEKTEETTEVSQVGDILSIPGGSDQWEAEVPAETRNKSLADEDMDTSEDKPSSPIPSPPTEELSDGEECEQKVTGDRSDEDTEMKTEDHHQDQSGHDDLEVQSFNPSSDESPHRSISQEEEEGNTTPTTLESDSVSCCTLDTDAMALDETQDPRFYEAVRKALKFPVPN